MIAVKRKAVNTITDKTLSVATNAKYTLDINNIRKTFVAALNTDNIISISPVIKQTIEDESKWCARWVQDLTEQTKAGNTTLTITPNIIIEKNSNIEYLDSDDISIDIFNERYLNRAKQNVADLRYTTKIVAAGVSNNFRFYNRPDCRIVVLDYRKLMDCLAFYYGYRELGLSIAHIEAVLENCSATVLNASTELEGLLKYTLGAYKSTTNMLDGLVQRKSGLVCRDNDMFELISNLRISTNCFQIIHSTHQVETWQHHKVPLTPKITYSAVLNMSRAEMLSDLLKGMMNEIVSNRELTNVKVLCADCDCIALSVPKDTTEEDLLNICAAQVRLFSRQFIIKPRLYTYNPMIDQLVEEDR